MSHPSRERQLSDVLSEFARTMATDFPIQAILDHLIARIVTMLPITAAGVTLISGDDAPRYVAASGDAALRYEQLQTTVGEGPCLLAYTSGAPVEVPDLRDETRFPTFAAGALEDGLRAVFTLPLHHAGHPLGALNLYRETPGGLPARAMTVAQTLADVAAAYLTNAQARQALEDSSQRSRDLALHDGLTGLPNRTLMLERLAHAFQRTRRTGKTSAVIFVDLDRFKAVNDTHGHGVGNQLLVAVAKRLRRTLRPPDTVARMHGDEFVILCEDLDEPEQAEPIMTRLAEAMDRPFQLATALIDISASVGIAFADHDQHDPEQVLQDADAAMYQAKRQGVGLQHVFDPRYQHVAKGRESLARDLGAALAGDQLSTEYQPIVASGSGEVLGFEAFLRWTHPTRGLLLPATFIPLAERAGRTNDMGAWTLRRACTDRRRWQHLRPDTDLHMAVNVSAGQLMSAGFVDTVDRALQSEDTSPHLLTLEITEGVLTRDAEQHLKVLHDLKDLGVRIALDDFGTGYSSLGYLNRFPVDIIKIDRSFVTKSGHDRVSNIIAGTVVQLAHALGMTAMAEGVETVEQHHAVLALGCDSSQGFYYAPPLSAGAADDLIRSGSGGSRIFLPASG